MSIDVIPPFPLRSQGLIQSVYSAGVEASLSAIPLFIQQLNAVGSAYALTTNGTSSSSVLIGTGAKSFTTQTGLGYMVGMTLRIANSSTNHMTADVTSYNTVTGALVMNVTAVSGSGTFASWTITMAAVGANSAGSISFTPSGNLSSSNVQAALQELDSEKLSITEGVKPGTIIDFAGTSAPSGYLVCPLTLTNISRTTYAALFAVIGTTWGAGDGSTTFGLPFFPADYAGVQANANVGTNHVGEVISHTHTSNAIRQPPNTGSNYLGAGTPFDGAAAATINATGGASNRAAGVRVLKCIKY